MSLSNGGASKQRHGLFIRTRRIKSSMSPSMPATTIQPHFSGPSVSTSDHPHPLGVKRLQKNGPSHSSAEKTLSVRKIARSAMCSIQRRGKFYREQVRRKRPQVGSKSVICPNVGLFIADMWVVMEIQRSLRCGANFSIGHMPTVY